MSGPSTLGELRARLAQYDGRSVTILGEAEAALRDEPGYIEALIALTGAQEGDVSAGVTWLIKSGLESRRAMNAAQVSALIDTLPAVSHWAAQLHLCQSIGLLELPAEKTGELAQWLDPLLDHQRPFVRAWAVDALGHAARVDAGLADRFAAALAKADEDDAASVRARARAIAKAIEA